MNSEEKFEASDTPGTSAETSALSRTEAERQAGVDAGFSEMSRIGPYRLLRPLGSGGMGVVYLAEQEYPLRRLVAVKIVRPGLDSVHVLARFNAERQALAMMAHPNIAHVFDAGVTGDGRPYFVMEYVDGTSLTRHCETGNLSFRERLKLLITVCLAIQHAHQKGVIHRDLKPSNVLVAVQDGEPVVKVIDFGIAKATDSRLTDDPAVTQAGIAVGTLQYMSPEQAGAGGADVDTRTDIYSLGVLLYELLTGTTPLRSISGVPYSVVLRRIAEEEPPPPSVRLAEQAAIPATRARKWSRGEGGPAAGIDRDLDWITARAMEKDRSRRYPTANAMARDLQRYLDREPVEAGPPSSGYRLRKLAYKYRSWVAVAAGFILVLSAAAGVASWLAVRATRAQDQARSERDRAVAAEGVAIAARNQAVAAEQSANEQRDRAVLAESKALHEKSRADQEAAIARAVNDFVATDLLAQASPFEQGASGATPERDLTVRRALERAAESVGARFRDRPLVEAAVRRAIGEAYAGLGLYDQAYKQHQRGCELLAAALGRHHVETLSATQLLGETLLLQARYAEAEALFRQLTADQSRVQGSSSKPALDALRQLGRAEFFLGRYGQAEADIRRVLRDARKTLGQDHGATIQARSYLAAILNAQGKTLDALDQYRQVHESTQRALGEDHLPLAASQYNVGVVLGRLGRYREAEPYLAGALEIRRRILGATHPDTLRTAVGLGTVCTRLGEFARAEELLGETARQSAANLGNDHPDTLLAVSGLGNMWRRQGRLKEAAAAFKEVYDGRRRRFGEANRLTIEALNDLAMVHIDSGNLTEAEATLRQALALLTPEHPDKGFWLNLQYSLASVYYQSGRAADAESLYRSVLETRRRLLGEDHEQTLACVRSLALSLTKQGKLGESEPLLDTLVAKRRKVNGDSDNRTIDAIRELAEVRIRQGAFAAAEPALRIALGALSTAAAPNWRTIDTQTLLAASLSGQKRLPEAERLLLDAQESWGKAAPHERAIQSAVDRAISLYEQWGKPEQAADWRDKLRSLKVNGSVR